MDSSLFKNANLGSYVASQQYVQPYPENLTTYGDMRRLAPSRRMKPQAFGVASAQQRYPAASGYDHFSGFDNILVDAPRDVAYNDSNLGQPQILSVKRNMSHDIRGDIAVDLSGRPPVGASMPTHGAYLTSTTPVRRTVY